MKMRPYGYACSNNDHHSGQHTGRHVLQWPSEDKDRSRDQRQQSGRVACWPKIVVHFTLHRLVGFISTEKKGEIIVISLHDFLWRVFLVFKRLHIDIAMNAGITSPIFWQQKFRCSSLASRRGSPHPSAPQTTHAGVCLRAAGNGSAPWRPSPSQQQRDGHERSQGAK
jgi:hypothetical protein